MFLERFNSSFIFISIMKLPDYLIEEYIRKGKIKIVPKLKKSDIRPVGVRVHLGKDILRYKNGQKIDLGREEAPVGIKYDLSKKPFVLRPGEFILGHTQERFKTDRDILCQLDGRSTIARLGLSVHITASIIDGAFVESHSIVLEIFNHSNVSYVLHEGLAIGCVTFELMKGKTKTAGQSYQYQGQQGLLPANLKKK